MSGRYDRTEKAVYVMPSGAQVVYLAPRILPQGAAVASGQKVELLAGEVNRLDLVAFRTLRNPELAWRIADANNAMNPFELCRHAGTVLDVPGSQL